VFEGRKLDAEGANVGPGLNSDSIGIAIAGFYDPQERNALNPSPPDLQPPPEAMAQLQALVEQLRRKYPSLRGAVSHGEARHAGTGCATTCPGPGCAGMIHSLEKRYFGGAR
ncbi:MAG: N-acetylmuramoyl-L-alanine amidase, partial [Bdellovibrionales bacterium]|nr:N-acetylmuramoyl-L-alanine amidase [Bdellovibrionales bacterium]